jgi:hypothetical protein
MNLPPFVREGTFTQAWADAPQRGDRVVVRVDFTEELATGDGEEWSHALLGGRANQTDEQSVAAMVSALSKHCPPELAGYWDVVLTRDDEGQPWALVKMAKRSA